ncbi:MAG: hypothetical protein KAV42_10050 [Candidatus Krumholzibacteria bacterium]|nr:hypothetical protein [Candidatus Krumholzibacteria bacterium]
MKSFANTILVFSLVIFISSIAVAAPAGTNGSGQDSDEQSDDLRATAPKIYIGCNNCDEAYLRTEIEFVNFVRDRKEADVHILVISQRTGSGGDEYTVEFIGQGGFAGVSDTLTFSTMSEATDDEVRREMVRIFKLGLVRYVAGTPLGKHLSIAYSCPVEDDEVVDKWNYWVYEIESDLWLNGEESYRSLAAGGELSARRVTEASKTYMEIYVRYHEQKFDIGDETILSLSRSRGFYGSHYISINDHWSWGMQGSYSASTYSNLDSRSRLSAGIEYNLFPYSESTRRQLRLIYWPSLTCADYTEKTIFEKNYEWLSSQNVSIVLEMIQPWGTIMSSLDGSHYFHDVSKNRLSWYNRISLKLFKGFSLNINGRISRVRDQLSLPAGDLSDEDILLRRQEVATDYNYYVSFGISYTFGSIYNNVVNPRFGN